MNSAELLKKEVEIIKNQIVEKFAPDKIFLFGSIAKGIFTEYSDVDLCVVKKFNNKRDMLTEIYTSVESEVPFDIILYTPEEWENFKNDKSSFAYSIITTGVKIYG